MNQLIDLEGNARDARHAFLGREVHWGQPSATQGAPLLKTSSLLACPRATCG